MMIFFNISAICSSLSILWLLFVGWKNTKKIDELALRVIVLENKDRLEME